MNQVLRIVGEDRFPSFAAPVVGSGEPLRRPYIMSEAPFGEGRLGRTAQLPPSPQFAGAGAGAVARLGGSGWSCGGKSREQT
jgi:hypothetical protein